MFPAQAQEWEPVRDPATITGPERCQECHGASYKVWEGQHHFSTFRTMPRSPKAREIADALEIRRIKTEPLCLSCHYTTKQTDMGRIKPIAGIACESCHGAGRDWIDVHSDFGAGASAQTESAEHKTERYRKSVEAGFIRPANIFQWAANCYSCHTVPQERLVNVGKHPAGSKFELVSWSQGEVRHNLWYSGGGENVQATPERKRMMYITGQTLDLAFALRGLAKATEKATYAVTMAKRAKAATLRLKKIAEAVTIKEVDEIIATATGAKLSLNNEAELNAAAEKIAAAAKKFTESYDGSTFAGVDAMIPGPDKYRGTPAGT